MGGECRREWALVQVNRRSKTRREGGQSGVKVEVLLRFRVADGGIFRTWRVTGKYAVNS